MFGDSVKSFRIVLNWWSCWMVMNGTKPVGVASPLTCTCAQRNTFVIFMIDKRPVDQTSSLPIDITDCYLVSDHVKSNFSHLLYMRVFHLQTRMISAVYSAWLLSCHHPTRCHKKYLQHVYLAQSTDNFSAFKLRDLIHHLLSFNKTYMQWLPPLLFIYFHCFCCATTFFFPL